jgi:cbb3-type cytochrome oxidase subunit 3
MSEFLEVLSPSALKDLQALNNELVKTVANVKDVNANMIGVKTPSGSDSAIKDLNAQLAKQTQLYAKAQIELERYAQAQNRTKISAIQVENAIERKNKALEREAQKLQASQTLYNKVQQKLNALSNEYKTLAIRKELSGKLTEQEAKRFEFLQTRIQKYDGALKAVDASMGKYQRNVGNYASAFNPLGNSINQLTREMPAFANSVQTGFMAISNNLPIFFDAMQQAIAQQKELQAQGQPSKNALQLLAGSFLTLGTALSVGVTLLTLFGPAIVDSIFNTKAKAKADEEAKKAVEAKNQAEQKYIDTIKNSAGEEIARSQILFENAKNVNISMKERLKAINDLRERYPDYLKNLSNQQILAGDTAVAEERLNDALVKRGLALGLQSKLTEEYNKLAEVLIKVNDVQINKNKLDTQDIETAKKLGISVKQLQKDREVVAKLNLAQYEKERDAIEENINNILKLFNQYSPYLSAVNETTEATKKGTKAKREDVEAIQMQDDSLRGIINKLRALKSALEKTRDEESKSKDDYDKFTKTIDAVQRSIDGLTTGYKELKQSGKDGQAEFERLYGSMAKVDGKTKQLTENIANYLKTFQEGFFAEAGLPTLFKVLDKQIEGFGENFAVTFTTMAEVAQEAFAFITEASNANFKNEYANLERQRDIALLFAGDSASAREEIERQAEEKRRAIQKREFQAKKQQALFNIAVDTAQAIIATLARTPLPAGLPLVIATGALGALQAGIVASQQMPAFWKGTDNAPEGFALTQERGREIITDKHGNIKSTGSDKGAQVTWLNKGDKVLNNEKTMDFLMFNNDLNNILTGNGISNPKVEVNAGMTDSQVNAIVSAIKTKETSNVTIDKRGIKEYVTKGRQITERMNSRVEFKGRNV